MKWNTLYVVYEWSQYKLNGNEGSRLTLSSQWSIDLKLKSFFITSANDDDVIIWKPFSVWGHPVYKKVTFNCIKKYKVSSL